MNVKHLALACVTTFLIALTGCSKESKESKETYTVDFLKGNDAKRTEILEACKQNKQSDENCKNANEAQNILYMEEVRKKENR